MSNEMEPAHLDIPWTQIIGFMLTAAFGVWVWVVKAFGEAHIESVKELAVELREMRKDLYRLSERVTKVEVQMEDS